MDCRTTVVHEFGARLGFEQYDIILIKKTISGNIKTQYGVFGYGIDLHFYGYKLEMTKNR